MTTVKVLSLSEQVCLKEGERYTGLVLDEYGTPTHHLIDLPGELKYATWQAAMDWASSIGGELPTRQEQALLFANCRDRFEPYWYWCCEQHASGSSHAWCQNFDTGGQYDSRKNGALRARAVRRLPLNHLIIQVTR